MRSTGAIASVSDLTFLETNILADLQGQKDLSRGQSHYPSILLSTPLLECAGLGTSNAGCREVGTRSYNYVI